MPKRPRPATFVLVTITLSAILGSVAPSLAAPSAAADFDLTLVETMRLRGELDAAKQLLTAAIENPDFSPDSRIGQHLEMARVLDRIGLHRNTRPVAEALTHIDDAAELLSSASEYNRAAVELAYADYYYRAEMSEREFSTAEEHARRAIALYEEMGDGYGQADAVHRLGLIEFQRRNLDSAEALFKESLDLDIEAGERTFFRGEYERHVGYVFYRRGDVESATRHFERSLQARRDAGAIDASLFAAVSLASTLIELDRRDEAKPNLDYALNIAQRIESPVGLERVNEAFERFAAMPSATN
jgi:tetratricopeptide (TPR) repeat protein